MKKDYGMAQREYFERLKDICRLQVPKIYQALLDHLKVGHLNEVSASERERFSQGVPILVFALLLGSQEDEILDPLTDEVPVGMESPLPPHFSRLRITPKGKTVAGELIASRWESMATVSHACWMSFQSRREGSVPKEAAGNTPFIGLIHHLLENTQCVEVKDVTKKRWLSWFDRWPGMAFLLARRCLSLFKPKAAQNLLVLGSEDKSARTLSQIRVVCDKNWTSIKGGMLQLTQGQPAIPVKAVAGRPPLKKKPTSKRAVAEKKSNFKSPALRRRRDASPIEPKLKSVGNWDWSTKSSAHAEKSPDAKTVRAIKAQLLRSSGSGALLS